MPNAVGYFSGLSSPSVTDISVTRNVSPQVVGGRADQVADVLHEQDPGVLGQPAVEVCPELCRFQVAQSAGQHLFDRCSGAGQAPCVVLGREVGGERRDRHAARAQVCQHPFQQGGLAAARAGQQVHHRGPPGGEFGAYLGRQGVVPGQDRLPYVDHSAHRAVAS
ncbi:hypothetical protein GCM10020000_01110 [Streptomyces olivoverticillatus]